VPTAPTSGHRTKPLRGSAIGMAGGRYTRPHMLVMHVRGIHLSGPGRVARPVNHNLSRIWPLVGTTSCARSAQMNTPDARNSDGHFDQLWWLVVCREGGSSDVCVGYVLGVGAAKLLLQRSGSQHHIGPVPDCDLSTVGGGFGRSRDRPLGVLGVHSRGRALASSSARCVPRRLASCSSWVRQENPSASTTVSRPESRTAGRSCCSAMATETS
jgi:hypothetical protein